MDDQEITPEDVGDGEEVIAPRSKSRYQRAIDGLEAAEGPLRVRDRLGSTCPECGHPLVAEETRGGGFVKVEGSCANCGFTFSRAGRYLEDEPEVPSDESEPDPQPEAPEDVTV